MSGLEIISKVEIAEANGFWLIFALCVMAVLNILFGLFLYKREKKGKKIFKSNIIIAILVVITLIIIVPCIFLSYIDSISTGRYRYVARITDSVNLKELAEKYDHIVFNDDGTISFWDKEIDN